MLHLYIQIPLLYRDTEQPSFTPFITICQYTTQDCSGVKLGGEQSVLLKKPSTFRVKHWLMPLLIAFWTKGKPIRPELLVVELKKNC